MHTYEDGIFEDQALFSLDTLFPIVGLFGIANLSAYSWVSDPMLSPPNQPHLAIGQLQGRSGTATQRRPYLQPVVTYIGAWLSSAV